MDNWLVFKINTSTKDKQLAEGLINYCIDHRISYDLKTVEMSNVQEGVPGAH